MELILERIAKRKTYTIGKLNGLTPAPSPNGEGSGNLFFCDTLEPIWRDYAHGGRKIAGHSAIPEGRYPVVITWSPKFQKWLPLLLHVPNFDGIRIHAGNIPTCCKKSYLCVLIFRSCLLLI